jgi:hypothetical protein
MLIGGTWDENLRITEMLGDLEVTIFVIWNECTSQHVRQARLTA